MKLSPELAAACLKLAGPARQHRSRSGPPDDRPMPWAVTVTVPVAVVSRPNRRDHWTATYRRNKAEAEAVAAELHRLGLSFVGGAFPRPLAVRLTRLFKGRPMDQDNLSSSFKAVQDYVAGKWLEIDDGSPLVRFSYAQERAAVPACRIEVTGTTIEEV